MRLGQRRCIDQPHLAPRSQRLAHRTPRQAKSRSRVKAPVTTSDAFTTPPASGQRAAAAAPWPRRHHQFARQKRVAFRGRQPKSRGWRQRFANPAMDQHGAPLLRHTGDLDHARAPPVQMRGP